MANSRRMLSLALIACFIVSTLFISSVGGNPVDFQLSGGPVKIFTNSLSGSVPVTVWSNESFTDMTVETFYLNETYYPDEEIYNEPYPGGTFIDYLANVTYNRTVTISSSPELRVSTAGGAGVGDIDLGLFLDGKDGNPLDGMAQAGEFIEYSATASNSEMIDLFEPENGTYIIKVAGFDVPGDPGYFDLTVAVAESGTGWLRATNIPTGTVPSFEVASFDLEWDFPGATADNWYSAGLYIGHASDPHVTYIQVSLKLDRSAPEITEVSPESPPPVEDLRPFIYAFFSDSDGELSRDTVKLLLDGEDITFMTMVNMPFSTGPTGEMGYLSGSVIFAPLYDIPLGIHQVAVEVEDYAGNIAQAQWFFTIADETPPVMDHTPEIMTSEGYAIPITARVHENFTLGGFSLLYKRAGDPSYLTLPMSDIEGSSNYVATIPPQEYPASIHYYLSAIDSSGNPATLPENSPDLNPFEIEIQPFGFPKVTHRPVESHTGEDIQVSALVSDDEAISGATLFYKKVGSPVYDSTPMINVGGHLYEGTIPGSAVSQSSVWYYIEASDGINVVTHPLDPSMPHLILFSGVSVNETLRIAVRDDVKTKNYLASLDVWTSNVLDPVYDTVARLDSRTLQPIPYILKGVDADESGTFDLDEYGVFRKESGTDAREVTAYYDFNGVFFHDGVQATMEDLLFGYHLRAMDPLYSGTDVLKDMTGLPGSNYSLSRWLGIWPTPGIWDPAIPVGTNSTLTFALHLSLQAEYWNFVQETLSSAVLFPRHVWEGQGKRWDEASGQWIAPIHDDFGYAYDPVTHNGVPSIDPLAYNYSKAASWDPLDDDVIGSGPFEFDSRNPGVSVRLSRFEEYKADVLDCERVGWPPICQGDFFSYMHKPLIGGMLFLIYTTAQATVFALQAGEVDVVSGHIPPEFVGGLLVDPNIDISTAAGKGFAYLGYNMRMSPFGYPNNDPSQGDHGYWLRRAVSHVVDDEIIVRTLLQNYGVAANQPVSPASTKWFNASLNPRVYDLDTARQILDDYYTIGGFALGWSGGYRNLPTVGSQQIEILAPQADYDPVLASSCNMIASNLRIVGINAIPRLMAYGQILEKLQQRDAWMWLLDWPLASEPPDYYFDMYYSGNAPEGLNHAGFQNDTFDGRILNARATFDIGKAAQYVKESSALLADALPLDPIFFKTRIEGYRSVSFVNWTIGPASSIFEKSYWSWIGVHPPSPLPREEVPRKESGEIMKVAVKEDVELDPRSASNHTSRRIIDLLYDSLGRRDPDTLEIVPWVANDWSVDEGLGLLTVNLRPQAAWHDGAQVTADDVKYSFEVFYGGYNLTVVSPTSVVFNFSAGGGGRFMTAGLLLPLVRDGDTDPVEGCGPFSLAARDSSHTLVEAFPDYFGDGPLLGGVDFIRFSGVEGAANAFINGTIDFIGWELTANDPTDLRYGGKTLLGTNGARVEHTPGLQYLYIGFNPNANNSLDDLNLRLSIAKLMNKELYESIEPFTRMTHSVMSDRNVPWYNSSLREFNAGYTVIDGSQATNIYPGLALLEESGYFDVDGDSWREKPDGSNISLSVLGPSLADDLRKATIAVNTAYLLQKVGLNASAVLDSSADPADHDIYLRVGYLSLDPSDIPSVGEIESFPDADLLIALQEADDALNVTNRSTHVREALGIISEKAPLLPISRYMAIEVYNETRFDGWVEIPGGINNFWSFMEVYSLFDTRMDRPLGLHAFLTSDPHAILTWRGNEETGLLNYSVYRGLSVGGPYQLIGEVPPRTSFVDSNVSWNDQFCYVITAKDGSVESSPSNEVCLSVSNVTSPPSGLMARLSEDPHADIVLNWTLSLDDGSGLNNVVRYDIYRSTSYDRAGLGYLLHDSVPSGTAGYVDINAGEGDSNNYFYRVCAIDLNNKTACAETQAGKFTRPLVEGWGLLSVPLVQSNWSVEVVLQTVRFQTVRQYVPGDRLDPWKSYSPWKGYSDLLPLDRETGLWVEVTADCNLTLAGVVPESTIIALSPGWNLVGFPSFAQNYTVDDLMVDILAVKVEGVDTSAQPHFLKALAPSDLLRAGEGYWINIPFGTWWVIRN